MKRLLLLSMLTLVGCGGQDGSDGRNGTNGKDGAPGPAGENGKDGANGKDGVDGQDGEDFTPAEETSLAGYWYLPNGGYIELLEDADGRIVIHGTQRIYSTNPDDSSLGLYLALAVGPYAPHDESFRSEYTATYVALTHNQHVGNTATVITGARKTVATFKINSSKKLEINVKIYGTTGLTVESDRTIISE